MLPVANTDCSNVQGNLCRCTGYRPILESLKPFTDQWAATVVPEVLACW